VRISSSASYQPARLAPKVGLSIEEGLAKIAADPKLVDPPEPTDKLPRPVLMIAGGSRQDVGLPQAIHYLTEGGNNHFGGSYGVDRKEQFLEEYRQLDEPGNVFTLRYSKQFASFPHNAQEIKQAIADIRQLTGAEEIDVVAECKGAMEMRRYLQDGNDGVRNLVMLVPPNHGLVMGGDLAWMVGKAVDKLHLPVKTFSGYPLDSDGLEAISSFSTDWSLGPLKGNKQLHSLNQPENMAQESEKLNSLTVISGEGKNLLEGQIGKGLPLPLMRGDHSIPNWSAFMPHAQNFFYDGDRAHHGQVKSDPDAMAKMAETLISDGQPSKDENYCESQPTAAQALTRSALWTTSFAGRAYTAQHALLGHGSMGPVGKALGVVGAGLAAADGTQQLARAIRNPEDRSKNLVGSAGKFAQAAGTVLGMAGGGWPAAALWFGGLAASTMTA